MTPEDEREIRELVVRYADAVSRLDPVAWTSTWASDGQWDLGTRTVVGREAIVELWTSLLPIYTSIIQLPAQGVVRESADGVTGRWLVLEILRKRDVDTDALQVACYVDHYVREEGRWVFGRRQLSPHYKGTLPPGAFVPLPPLD
jgi:hypothetical protein